MSQKVTILSGECDLSDDVEPEYDFAVLKARAKELGREYRGVLSGMLVRLDPELSAFFQTPEAVNEALRRVMREMQSAA